MEASPIKLALSSSNLSAASDANQYLLQISGGSQLHGQVRISGAKNAALVILAGGLLCSQDCRIRNVPSLVDVARMGQILTALGVKLHQDGDVIDINATHLSQSQAPYELVSRLRA
ncbi:MAG: UDP-N-acetylglucosamine 1-carboxyvinyltransferase, partial [Oscillatoriales cyanobacterium RM1_1_9]|nr:UDP-N-acetylglucosamine 1-carboxyvinyltransferase [Oscillatoriales cyanobacterium RM1_1_9]